MSKFGSYIQAAYDELVHKVTWPSWQELQQTTVIVLVAMAIFTLMIWCMDQASAISLQFLYGILG